MGERAIVSVSERSSRLESRILRVLDLPEGSVEEMFELFRSNFDRVGLGAFRKDLGEKEFVILLRDPATARIRGFSTQTLYELFHEGRRVRILYSGDTIIDPRFWGEHSLVRSWCRLAGALRAEDPAAPLYWFLICKGYRTYLYLPLFFQEYDPRPDPPAPFPQRSLLDAFGAKKFPGDYNPRTGVIEFKVSRGQMAPALADVAKGRAQDPRVRFFLDRNPGYRTGHELACLASIHPENMKSFAKKYVLEGECLGLSRILSRS